MAILECRGLCKSYGAEPALDRVDLAVEPGHIVGLLGPNGSGKSTLIKLANGLLTPDAGEILIDGMAPGKDTKKIVSYLPERTYFADWMTALQLLDFFGDFYDDFDRAAAVQMMQRLGIQPKQQIKQMSKGTREKVQLILVMSRKAKLYLLDEPIGGVDPATRDYILSTIISNYNPEAAVVISTHLIADVEHILDDVAFLSRGHLLLQRRRMTCAPGRANLWTLCSGRYSDVRKIVEAGLSRHGAHHAAAVCGRAGARPVHGADHPPV